MSFRSRLTLFFVAIVIVPMASMAIVLFRLLSDNEHGKGDARIAARQEAAIHLYEDARRNSSAVARRIAGTDAPLAAALRSGKRVRIQRRTEALRRSYHVARILVRDPKGVTPMVDQFEVRIHLDNPIDAQHPHGIYYPGQVAHVKLSLARKPLMWQWMRRFWQIIQTNSTSNRWM